MELALLVGVELVLFFAVGHRIRTHQRLLDQLRRCHTDLASALAHVRGDDIAAARRLLVKWPDFKRLPRPHQSDGTRLH